MILLLTYLIRTSVICVLQWNLCKNLFVNIPAVFDTS